MLFKKKEIRLQEDEIADPAGEKEVAAGESQANDLDRIPTETVYPSGLKLALLMTSIFVGIFLVALVGLHSD